MWKKHGRGAALALMAGALVFASSCGDDSPPRRPSNGTGGQPDDPVSTHGGGQAGAGDSGTDQKPASRHEVEIIPGPEGVPADTPGVIRGVVLFEGEPPARREIKIAGGGCQHEGPPQLKEDLVVTDGRVQYACVYVDKGIEEGSYAVPDEPVFLDQEGCMYTPHVVSVQVGQKLLVRNSDQTMHNVNWPEGNKMQPMGSAPVEIVYERDGAGLFYRCDLHPWMSAFICVADHPFQQVTGEDGAFSLPEIPPGRYELVLWTEKFNKDRGLPAVDVPPGGEVVVTFRLSVDAGRRRRRGR